MSQEENDEQVKSEATVNTSVKKKSGFAVAGLVLGIIGVCTSFIPIVNNLSFILALIGILFGIVSLIQKASVKMSIVGIVVCILTIVFTVQAQEELSNSINDAIDDLNDSISTVNGENTEDILANYCNVTFGNFEVDEDGFFTDTNLNVNVENKSSEKKSFSIHIEAVDENGSRIDDDYIYVNDLNANQSQNFNAFTLVSSDKIDAMKTATFNVVEISMY
jgi:hypothetical protein